MNLQNFSIRTRLLSGFGILMALLVAVAVIGYVELLRVNDSTDVIVHDRMVKVQLAQSIENEINRQARALRTALIARESATIEAELQKVEASGPVVEQALQKLQATLSTEDGKRALRHVLDGHNLFSAEEKRLIAMVRERRVDEARQELVDRLIPIQNTYLESVQALLDIQAQSIEAFATQAAQEAKQGEQAIAALVAVAVLLAAGVSGWISRSIVQPMGQLLAGMKTVEHNADFAFRIAVTGRDEVGQVSQAFNDLLSAQQTALGQVRQAVAAMAAGDFGHRVSADLRGDLDALKQAINQSVDSMRVTMAEVNRGMHALSEGQFKVQLDARVQGEFKLTLQMAQEAMDRLHSMMSDIGRVMQDVAQGQLRVQVRADARGDLELLKRNINESVQALAETLAQMREGTQLIAAQATQTNDAVSQIAFGAQTQSSSVEQVSTALRLASQAISDIAENTDQATQQSRNSVAYVRSGKAKIAEMITVVEHIAQNSQKINKISEVIEHIAYRTNLLSLNAAIEAARAGEQGKGFAVVADEVGKLAISSADSTKEITQLVQQAATQAQLAVQTVAAVERDMDAIEVGAISTDSMLGRVASSVEEQSAAIREIDANVSSLSQVAVGNANASEELSASAQELSKIAAANEKALSRFSF
jgi:methyl-accepting chemotaxis protein